MHCRPTSFVRQPLVLIAIVATLVPAPLSLHAQDSRTVVEPFFPQLCTTLDAQLQASGGSLAPADEQKLDTDRIQKAIDKCGRGRAVMLHVNEQNNAFLSGPLELRPDVKLIIGVGVTLFASRDPAAYATSAGSCGIVSHGLGPRGCKPLISVDHAPNSGIMGDGIIDGRGGEKMLGSQYSWWDLAEQARAGGAQQVFRLVVANNSDNFTMYRVTLKNSPNFHVVYDHGDGFTAWGVKIDTPQRLARNTDGIDPGDGAKNVTITHSYIRAGDDNVAIKGGAGGATNMTISHDHFYWGHGMSIGSETNGGVSKIRVFDLSLDGPDNGIRIKSNGSRGGLTQDVAYDNVCIRNSPNPITLDTAYSANGPLQGNSPPTMRDIALHNVRVSGGGKITFNGYDPAHRIAVKLDGVQIADNAQYRYELDHADITLGPEPTNLQLPAGTDSTITGKPAEGNPASCAQMFVPFPQ
ncbi:Polygalacturonase [Candidatus Sulfotelmatomonas gaucii]|uniref:Polygalacturonase n=1 Tax=Candidatus Sulfuritelmatomonas gaucii TaxID=2043161 RepID=A0A2N9L2F8_9BACT|nr:Polygalacturonase [Candidatus Sulfotelmatomonas gaucii]